MIIDYQFILEWFLAWSYVWWTLKSVTAFHESFEVDLKDMSKIIQYKVLEPGRHIGVAAFL